MNKQIGVLNSEHAAAEFDLLMDNIPTVAGVPVLAATLSGAANPNTLRQMTDQFRQRYTGGAVVLGSVVNDRPIIIAAVDESLAKRGVKANDLVKFVAKPLGGGGGGTPTLAQAGGRDASKLDAALASVAGWVAERLGA